MYDTLHATFPFANLSCTCFALCDGVAVDAVFGLEGASAIVLWHVADVIIVVPVYLDILLTFSYGSKTGEMLYAYTIIIIIIYGRK